MGVGRVWQVKMMARILIPLPSYGFDPTEAAIPWKILSENHCEVVFVTPRGEKGAADAIMLTGRGLGVWKWLLRARRDGVEAYGEMEKSASFCNPLKYTDVEEGEFHGILLPGGHHKGVREYLESEVLQSLVARFFLAGKPVAAICHGVLLVARSMDPGTGRSVIRDYKTTSLLKSQELLAYHLTRLWLGDYYLTYPGRTVEDEVKSALATPKNFLRGPFPLLRDSGESIHRGFSVRDRNYLSARWPGDVYNFSFAFVEMLQEYGVLGKGRRGG